MPKLPFSTGQAEPDREGTAMPMAHLQNLVQLAQGTPQASTKELDFDSFDEGGSLNFDNL